VNDQTDAELLRDYVEHHREQAFADLVHRHLDLVHSAAVRMVCDSHLANDVTQGVFVALAKSAPQLTSRPVLSGWLHRTAQNIAAQTVRTDTRRRAREQEAVAMNKLHAAESESPWQTIAPHLDAALGELNDVDRDALLLRYFERKTAPEMAGILGISHEAAQKRVTRALDRLRDLFTKRGVTVGAGGLGVVLTAHAVQAAPAGLGATVSSTALAAKAAATSTVITTTKLVAMTTLQKTLATAVVIALTGAGFYEARHAAQLRAQNQSLLQKQSPLLGQLSDLQRERDNASNQLSALLAEGAALKARSNEAEIVKLRGQLAQFREAKTAKIAPDDSREELMRSWLQREDQLKAAIKQNPDKTIPELSLLSEEDFLNAAMDAKFDTDKGLRQTLANLRRRAENIFASIAADAVTKYMKDHDSRFPTYLSDLLPYFKTPLSSDILDRWQILPQSALPNQSMGGDWVITEKSPVDATLDNRWAIGPGSYGNSTYQSPEVSDAVGAIKPAMQAYAADHNGQQPTDPSQILPYVTTPEEQAAFQKLMEKFPTNPVTGKAW